MNKSTKDKVNEILEYLKTHSVEFNLMFCCAEYISRTVLLKPVRTTHRVLNLMVEKNLLKFKLNTKKHPKRFPIKFYYLIPEPP